MVLAICLAGIVAVSDDAYAETEYDKSLGSFWSYTVQFIFDGEQTQSVQWDFGDGSEISTEWNPKHTFPDKGVYYVTQTVTNTIGSTSTVYKVTILGFPYITLVYNNGEEDGRIQQTAYNVVAEQPEDPVNGDKVFTGWFTDVDCTVTFDWNTTIASPVTIYAGWQDPVNHTVSFDVDGGSVALDDVTVVDGGLYALPGYDGVRDGYTFSGWMVDGVRYDVGQSVTVTSDTTAKAVWTVRQYTVSFDSDVPSQTVDHGSTATQPEDPVREGYTFVDWTLDGEHYDFYTPVIQDISLVAQWQPITYTVLFDSDGGSSVVSQTVSYGGKATVPSEPTRSGYTFVQWTLDGTAYDFDTVLTQSITLVASWRADTPVDPGDTYHAVSFDSDGGSSVSFQSIVDGATVTKPADPVREGYTFTGWFIGDSKYDFSSPVRSSFTLTAHWDAITYAVTFDSDGGSSVDSQTVQYGGKAVEPRSPVREGFSFIGWFLNDTAYDFDSIVTEDLTLTAHWTEDEPDVPEGDGPGTDVPGGDGPGTDEPGEGDGEKDLGESFKTFLIVSLVAVLVGLLAFVIVRL